jgi:hypothetical protein
MSGVDPNKRITLRQAAQRAAELADVDPKITAEMTDDEHGDTWEWVASRSRCDIEPAKEALRRLTVVLASGRVEGHDGGGKLISADAWGSRHINIWRNELQARSVWPGAPAPIRDIRVKAGDVERELGPPPAPKPEEPSAAPVKKRQRAHPGQDVAEAANKKAYPAGIPPEATPAEIYAKAAKEIPKGADVPSKDTFMRAAGRRV